jgi:hypothetical protein
LALIGAQFCPARHSEPAFFGWSTAFAFAAAVDAGRTPAFVVSLGSPCRGRKDGFSRRNRTV